MNEESLDLRQYIGILLSRWWLLLLAPLLASTAAYAYSRSQTPIYEAGITILVQETRSGLPSFGDVRTSQDLVGTYRELITSRPVLEEAGELLEKPYSADGLKGRIATVAPRGSQFLRLAVRDSDPAEAAEIANVVAETFIRRTQDSRLAEIASLQSAAAAQGILNTEQLLTAQMSALGSMSIVEPALPPASPILPRTRSNVILAAMVGGMLAVFGALMLEFLHNTVQTPERLQARFGLTNLGTIPRWTRRDLPADQMWLRHRPSSSFAEAFRQIRTNLQFVTAAHPTKTVLVTSPGPAEGKSTLVANVGLALAQGGIRTIIIDTDLRRPSIHRFFGLDNGIGVTTFLVRPETALDDVLQDAGEEHLHVITSGPMPPNPGELLGTPRMQALIDQANARADIVLLDSPPLLVVADSTNLVGKSDSVILVADAQYTRMDSVRLALETLKHANVQALAVVNKLKPSWAGYGYAYGHYYYYRYRSYYTAGNGSRSNGRRAHGLLSRLQRTVRGRR